MELQTLLQNFDGNKSQQECTAVDKDDVMTPASPLASNGLRETASSPHGASVPPPWAGANWDEVAGVDASTVEQGDLATHQVFKVKVVGACQCRT